MPSPTSTSSQSPAPFELGVIGNGYVQKPNKGGEAQHTQAYYIKIFRGAVATYYAGEGKAEVKTTEHAEDLKTLKAARAKSRELLFDESQKIDVTEVEMVAL